MSTIYCNTTSSLPIAAMAHLCDDAKFSTQPAVGPVSQYIYEWADFTIQINVMPEEEIANHIDGFIGYLQNIARTTGATLSNELLQRIRQTKLVLGFVASPDIANDSQFDRLQDAIGMICYNTNSLVFWEGRVHDENAILLFPPCADG